jgi:hypothetical protein
MTFQRCVRAFALSGVLPGLSGAQEAAPPRLDLRPAIAAHVGFATVDQAKNTLEYGIAMDVGPLRQPQLRLVLGLDYLRTDTRRTPGGSFSDVSLIADLQWKPLRIGATTPYVGAGLGAHIRSNDIADPNVADIYDGVAVGGQLFAGAQVDANDTSLWGFAGELRLTKAQNLNRTALRAAVFRRF